MALIELLERPDWAAALERSLTLALHLLQTDRFRPTSSAVDDLRAWLTAGGAPRVLVQIRAQMAARRLPVAEQEHISAHLERLLHAQRHVLLDLMARGVIPASREGLLHALDSTDAAVAQLWEDAARGTLDWEGALRAQGHSNATIDALRQAIDRWLAAQGLRPPPDASQN